MEPEWNRRADHIFYTLYFLFLFGVFYIFFINPPTFCDNNQLWCYEYDSYFGEDPKMVLCNEESVNRTIESLFGHHLTSYLIHDLPLCCIYRIITDHAEYEGTVLGCLNEILALGRVPEYPFVKGYMLSYKCYTNLCNPKQDSHNVSFIKDDHHRLIFQRPSQMEYVPFYRLPNGTMLT